MNQHFSSFFHTVIASVLSGLILYWITSERIPAAPPSVHCYFMVPEQPKAAAAEVQYEAVQ